MTDPAAETATDMTTEPTLAEQAAAVRAQIAQKLAQAESMRTEADELEARAVALRRDAQTLANTTRGQEHEAAGLEARAQAAAAVPGLEAKAAAADAAAQALSDERAGTLDRVEGLGTLRIGHFLGLAVT